MFTKNIFLPNTIHASFFFFFLLKMNCASYTTGCCKFTTSESPVNQMEQRRDEAVQELIALFTALKKGND